MASTKNNGRLTWIMTLITVIIAFISVIAFISALIATATGGSLGTSEIIGIVIYIILGLISIYVITEGFRIMKNSSSNSILYTVLSFFGAGLIGGILMLIALLLD